MWFEGKSENKRRRRRRRKENLIISFFIPSSSWLLMKCLSLLMIPSLDPTYIFSPVPCKRELQLGLFFPFLLHYLFLTIHTDDETRRDGEALGFDLIHFPASFFFLLSNHLSFLLPFFFFSRLADWVRLIGWLVAFVWEEEG